MGLDVTAYQYVRPAADGEGMSARWPDEPDDEAGYVRLYVNPDFPAHAGALRTGVYHTSGERHGFLAGSYSGYNAWRDQLARMAGYESARAVWAQADTIAGRPFVGLINFSDCEGVIGPAVCAALAADFAAHQPQADAHPDAWFRAKYADWRRACELAADGGAVELH